MNESEFPGSVYVFSTDLKKANRVYLVANRVNKIKTEGLTTFLSESNALFKFIYSVFFI